MYTVSKCGYHSRHLQTEVLSHPHGLPHYLLLLIKCNALFYINGQKITVPPDSVILIAPNVPYAYHGIKGEFCDDWLHFQCEESECFENARIPLHQPIPVGALHLSDYFRQIVRERQAPEALRRENQHMLMQLIRNNLILACSTSDTAYANNPFAAKLQDLRMKMNSQLHKNFSCEELAASLHISPSYFQHIYKEFFGVSFKSDLIEMRMERARRLLRETDAKMSQIAELCGYSSEVHFYRQFRQKNGITPRDYRFSISQRSKRASRS